MRGGALPPSLLCAALGVSLAFAAPRALVPGLLLLVAAALTAQLAPIPSAWIEAVFLCAWTSVVGIAASIHLPGGVSRRLSALLAVAAGALAGALTNVAGGPLALAAALPWALLALPAGWLVRRKYGVAVKVAGSWLIAVALLAAGLSFVPTPGYVPDHME